MLQRLTEHCALEDALRDHQVCRMKDEAVQKMITLTKDNLTLTKAIEIAEMSERAELDAAQLRWSSQHETTQMVSCK